MASSLAETNRKAPTFTAAGPPLTFDSLVLRMRDASHGRPWSEIAPLLVEDARVHVDAFAVDQEDGGSRYGVWQTGASILAGLTVHNAPLTIPAQLRALDPGMKRELLTLAGGLSTRARVAEGVRASQAETDRTILRILCSRSSLQRDFVYQFVQTLHLLGVWDLAKSAPGDGYCDPLFRAAFDCTAHEYTELLIGAWAVALKNCALKPSEWFAASADVERLRAVAARVLSGLSVPAEEVAERIRTEFREYEADGLVQAWFSQAPFVRASDGVFLAAPHPFLRLAAAAGAFYRALSLARGDAEHAGSLKPWTNAYSSEMGRRFETFMSSLLEKARSTGDEVAAEYSYLKGQEALSPDFLITNTLRPREVLLVQAKLKRLVPGAFYGFSAEDFRGDATGAIAELVWKTLRYVYRVETTPDARLDDAHRPLHDLIRQAETIGLLGVLPAMPSLFHVKEFRDLVQAGVQENLKAEEHAWLEKNAQRFSLWHIFDTEELCAFIAARTSDESLLGALRLYLRLPGFGALARDDGIAMSFRDWYITTRAGGRVRTRVPELKEVFDAFFDATSRKFFPRPIESAGT